VNSPAYSREGVQGVGVSHEPRMMTRQAPRKMRAMPDGPHMMPVGYMQDLTPPPPPSAAQQRQRQDSWETASAKHAHLGQLSKELANQAARFRGQRLGLEAGEGHIPLQLPNSEHLLAWWWQQVAQVLADVRSSQAGVTTGLACRVRDLLYGPMGSMRPASVLTLKAPDHSREPCTHEGCLVRGCTGNLLHREPIPDQANTSTARMHRYMMAVPHHKNTWRGKPGLNMVVECSQMADLIDVYVDGAREVLYTSLGSLGTADTWVPPTPGYRRHLGTADTWVPPTPGYRRHLGTADTRVPPTPGRRDSSHHPPLLCSLTTMASPTARPASPRGSRPGNSQLQAPPSLSR
jgi:hypothetical protein